MLFNETPVTWKTDKVGFVLKYDAKLICSGSHQVPKVNK